MHINGHTLPIPHNQWESFFEELFFHTSRYFATYLHAVESVSGQHYPDLLGFHADELSSAQRFVLAWMLIVPLDRHQAKDVLSVLSIFHRHYIEKSQAGSQKR